MNVNPGRMDDNLRERREDRDKDSVQRDPHGQQFEMPCSQTIVGRLSMKIGASGVTARTVSTHSRRLRV